MATIHLDSQVVGQTAWKPCNQQCWDQRFQFELDRVRKFLTNLYTFYSVNILNNQMKQGKELSTELFQVVMTGHYKAEVKDVINFYE